MSPRSLVAVLLFAPLMAACDGGGDGLTLVLDVRTDLSPGTDFARVFTIVDGRDPVVLPAAVGEDWATSGRRAAEVSGLARGVRAVRVELRADDGGAVVARDLRFEMNADLGMTVVLTRDCVARECPSEGGVELSCLGGRCVPHDCSPVAPASCGVPACATDGECPSGACLVGLCASGVCLSRTDPGCVSDAGIDAGTDAMADGSATDVGVDTSTPPDATADAPLDASGPMECVPTPDLLACYAFEGDLTDGAGAGIDLTGDVTYGPGRFGSAMTIAASVAGVTGETRLGPAEVTYEAWFRAESFPTGDDVMIVIARDGAYRMNVRADGALECEFAAPGGPQIARAGFVVPLRGWVHAACTINPLRGAQLWVSGVEEAWTPTGVLPGGAAFTIGADSAGDFRFDGAIDRVRIWSRALENSEVLAAATGS